MFNTLIPLGQRSNALKASNDYILLINICKTICKQFRELWHPHCIPLRLKQRSAVTLSANADYRLDFRGAITSLSLLKLTRVFREMKPNQTLEVIGLDADTRYDLFRLLPAVAYELIDIDARDDTSIRVYLRKT